MRSRYDLMSNSSVIADDGTPYKDPLTLPLNRIRYTDSFTSVFASQIDIDRFDLLQAKFYGAAELDDIILWLNNYASVHEITIDDEIHLISKRDLEKFYIENII